MFLSVKKGVLVRNPLSVRLQVPARRGPAAGGGRVRALRGGVVPCGGPPAPVHGTRRHGRREDRVQEYMLSTRHLNEHRVVARTVVY